MELQYFPNCKQIMMIGGFLFKVIHRHKWDVKGIDLVDHFRFFQVILQ